MIRAHGGVRWMGMTMAERNVREWTKYFILCYQTMSMVKTLLK